MAHATAVGGQNYSGISATKHFKRIEAAELARMMIGKSTNTMVTWI